MACVSRRLSKADGLVLGAIQIMIGGFYVLMWYFLLILYMAQIEGVFGIYEPITFRTASFLWGITFIISGVLVIGATRHPSLQLYRCGIQRLSRDMVLPYSVPVLASQFGYRAVSQNAIEGGSVQSRDPPVAKIVYALVMNILSAIVAVASGILIIIELSEFNSISYRNFGQAKVGRQVSRILMTFYPLEFCIALTYSIFSCISLWDFDEDTAAAAESEEEVETHF